MPPRSDSFPPGVTDPFPDFRITGNRKGLVWLPVTLLAAQATQARAIGTRRYVYLIIDPPPGPAGNNLRSIVTLFDAKDKLRLLPDPITGDIDAGAKRWAEERISGTLACMREQGLFDPRLLLDGRSEERGLTTFEDAAEWLEAVQAQADTFPTPRQKGQPQRYECWTEAADTMTDLDAALAPYDVRSYSSSGQSTVGAIDRMGRRIVEDTLLHPHPTKSDSYLPRPTVVLYVGDFDPPGVAMPKEIERGAVWAHRWWQEHWLRQIYTQQNAKLPKAKRLGRAEIAALAWTKACETVGNDPGPFKVEVIRVAVLQDDLALYSGTSRVSDAAVEQYRQWWPIDPSTGGFEAHTLQVEGLPIADVVQRVVDKLDDMFDADAREEVDAFEDEQHRIAREAIVLPEPEES